MSLTRREAIAAMIGGAAGWAAGCGSAEVPVRSQAKLDRLEAARRRRRIIFVDDNYGLSHAGSDTPEGFLAPRLKPLIGTQVDAITYAVYAHSPAYISEARKRLYAAAGRDFGHRPGLGPQPQGAGGCGTRPAEVGRRLRPRKRDGSLRPHEHERLPRQHHEKPHAPLQEPASRVAGGHEGDAPQPAVVRDGVRFLPRSRPGPPVHHRPGGLRGVRRGRLRDGLHPPSHVLQPLHAGRAGDSGRNGDHDRFHGPDPGDGRRGRRTAREAPAAVGPGPRYVSTGGPPGHGRGGLDGSGPGGPDHRRRRIRLEHSGRRALRPDGP